MNGQMTHPIAGFTYYSTSAACPNCMEPHASGIPLTSEGSTLYCPSCHRKFRKKIDLRTAPFRDFVSTATECGGLSELDEDFVIPRQIIPNSVESDLIDFVLSGPKGKFLVTWPENWGKPKCLPLAAVAYLTSYPDKRVAVIYDAGWEEGGQPDALASFLDLYVSAEPVALTGDLGRRVRKNLKRNIEKSLLISQRHTFVTIRFLKRPSNAVVPKSYTSQIPMPLNQAIRELRKELETVWGDGAICSVRTTRNGKDGKKIKKDQALSEKGFIDINAVEQDFIGDIKYNIESMINFVLARARSAKESIPYCVLGTGPIDIGGKRLIFVPSSVEDPLTTALAVEADLILIEDADRWVEERAIGESKGYGQLVNFLNTEGGTSVFLFSLNPLKRDYYGIGDENDPMQKCGITNITFDNARIVDMYRTSIGFTEGITTACSSGWSGFKQWFNPHVEYHRSDKMSSLLGIELQLDYILRDVKRDKYEEVIFYLTALSRSLGAPRTMGSSVSNTFFESLDYEKALSILESSDPVAGKAASASFAASMKAVFGDELMDTPLLDETVALIKGMDADEFILVANQKEIERSASSIQILAGKLGKKISLTTWTRLEGKIKESTSPRLSLVLLMPAYNLSFLCKIGPTTTVHAIGSEYTLSLIELTVENRMSEIVARPLWIPENPTLLPTKYAELITKCTSDPSRLRRLRKEARRWGHSGSNAASAVSNQFLQPGDNAFLIVSNNQSFFLPAGIPILTLTDAGFIELGDLDISVKELDKFIGKTALLDKAGIYRQFKNEFTEMMLNHQGGIMENSGKIVWKTYSSMFRDSQLWIRRLEEAVNLLVISESKDLDTAENEVAALLSTSGMYAKNHDYIKKWWKEFEERDGYRIYGIEHPFLREDVIKMYEALNVRFPKMQLSLQEAMRSYDAALKIQQIRTDLLKEVENASTRPLLPKAKDFLADVKEKSKPVKISKIYKCKMVSKVRAFWLIDNQIAAKYAAVK